VLAALSPTHLCFLEIQRHGLCWRLRRCVVYYDSGVLCTMTAVCCVLWQRCVVYYDSGVLCVMTAVCCVLWQRCFVCYDSGVLCTMTAVCCVLWQRCVVCYDSGVLCTMTAVCCVLWQRCVVCYDSGQETSGFINISKFRYGEEKKNMHTSLWKCFMLFVPYIFLIT
jgi:hypothetical protein